MSAGAKDPELANLVLAARQGDGAALNRLLRSLWPWLRRKAEFVLGRKAPLGISSLTQETALRFSRSIEKTHAMDSPSVKALLHRIMRNTALDAYRASACEKRDARLCSDDDLSSATELQPERELLYKEQTIRVAEAISRLPPRQQKALMLYLDERTFDEIAEELDCSGTAAQMLVQRAKSELRTLFEEFPDSSGNHGR